MSFILYWNTFSCYSTYSYLSHKVQPQFSKTLVVKYTSRNAKSCTAHNFPKCVEVHNSQEIRIKRVVTKSVLRWQVTTITSNSADHYTNIPLDCTSIPLDYITISLEYSNYTTRLDYTTIPVDYPNILLDYTNLLLDYTTRLHYYTNRPYYSTTRLLLYH